MRLTYVERGQMKENYIGWIAILVGSALLIIGGRIAASARDEAQREACSYRCNLLHGKWPARVEYKGYDKSGHIGCSCLYDVGR